MNMLSKVTPWPWSVPHFATAEKPDDCQCGYILSSTCMGAVATVHKKSDDHRGDDPPLSEAIPNAKLLQLAPDHALLLSAIVEGPADFAAHPTSKSGLGVRLLVHDGPDEKEENFAIDAFDPFGAPILTPELRAALKTALGLGP